MRIRRSARRRGKPLASGAFGGIFGDKEVGDDPIREQASRLGHAEVVAGALEQAALDEARGDGLGGRREPGRRDALAQAQAQHDALGVAIGGAELLALLDGKLPLADSLDIGPRVLHVEEALVA